MESAVVYYCKFLLEIEGSKEINVEKIINIHSSSEMIGLCLYASEMLLQFAVPFL